MLALFDEPSNKIFQKRIDKLNDLIIEQNKKDSKKGADISQGTIDYGTYIAIAKLYRNCQDIINSPPTNDLESKNQRIA
jgi:hypothetical protein